MAKKKNLRNALKRIYFAFRFNKNLYVRVDLPESNITEAEIYVKEGDTERILTTGGGGGEEWTKTNLYINENPTAEQTTETITGIDDYEYIEVKYNHSTTYANESASVILNVADLIARGNDAISIGFYDSTRFVRYNNGLMWDECKYFDPETWDNTYCILTEVNGYRKAV